MPHMYKRVQKKALALRYDPLFPAPFIAARGTGRMADHIEELALSAGVPVVRDDLLASALVPLDPGTLIPPEYWEVIAKILVAISSFK